MASNENLKTYAVITGSGSYIPKKIVKNSDFLDKEFYEGPGKKIEKDNEEIIEKFYQITDIGERRYVEEHLDDVKLLLYFTDLDGFFPKEPPSYKVKWIVPQEKEVPFGEVIKID